MSSSHFIFIVLHCHWQQYSSFRSADSVSYNTASLALQLVQVLVRLTFQLAVEIQIQYSKTIAIASCISNGGRSNWLQHRPYVSW